MDTASAMLMGALNRGKEQMVFDWDTAARIIKERNPIYAEAGLSGDWGNTGGMIFYNGKAISDSYTYLASTWAKPCLMLYTDKDQYDGEMIECYLMKSNAHGWSSKTKWPDSALDILGFTKDDLKQEDEEYE